MALEKLRQKPPQLILLDLGLPRIDGLEVTGRIRSSSTVPIIILTARVEESDRIRGLDMGADDYLTKPFSPRELVARVRAVLRRSEPQGPIFRLLDLELDLTRRKILRGGQPVELTATELDLMAAMVRHPGRVFTRAQLLDAARGETPLVDEDESFDRAIDAHIKNIRRKLELDPRRPRYLLTVYGVGYKCTEG